MDLSSKIINTLKRLCSIRSTSGTSEEVPAACEVHSIISEIGYFANHKNNLILHNIKNDTLGRKYISALYESGRSKRTVVLLSHFDVVGVEEFGSLIEYAYEPDKYTNLLAKEELNSDAASDLSSGSWLFGRGTMDMKCGLAVHIELLRHIYENHIDIDGNILLITVPDEENSSAGMLSAVEYLSELKDNGFEFTAAINCEPYFEEYPGDINKYIYTGTIGKLLPFVFSAGIEAHAVEPFRGLSSTLLSSAVTSQIEGNTELCNRYNDTVSPPPVCLKQADIKDLYSVTMPCYSYAYYNYFTLTSSPAEVLQKIKNICIDAFNLVIEKTQQNSKAYAALKHMKASELNITANAVTYMELLDILKKRNIPFEGILAKYAAKRMDTRDVTAYIVMDMLKCVPDLRPVMVVGFAPPYYPHRGCSKNHNTVLRVCDNIIDLSNKEYGEGLTRKDFFPGLCDLSYLGFENPDEYRGLKHNMPVFDMLYSLPVDALSSIDIPGINIGVMGRDAHKYTERLNIPYSAKITPGLVLYAIIELLKKQG